MNRQELNVLVRGVAQQFERETGLFLTARALDALVTPALSHLDTITRELDERKITMSFLEGAVRTGARERRGHHRRTGRNRDFVLHDSRLPGKGMPVRVLALTHA